MASWTWEDALSGVIPPMISPLTKDHAADTHAVHSLAEYILEGGCSGLFVLGGIGEGPWLSTMQRDAVIRASVDAAAGRAPVLVGLMLPGTAPARDAAKQAEAAGADALVVGSPYYFGVGAADQQRHVEAVLQSAALPVLLYNIPQSTHVPLHPDAVAALSSERRVLGIKDSWGEMPYFQSMLTLKLRRPSFKVLQGNEYAAMGSLLLGADGLIPGLGNVAPKVLVELVRAAKTRDVTRCQELHAQILDLIGVYASGLVGMHAACSILGLSENVPAEPWAPVTGERLSTIETVLSRNGLTAKLAAV